MPNLCDFNVLPFAIADQQVHIERSEQLLTTPVLRPVLYWSQAERCGVVLGFSQQISVLNQRALAIANLPVYHRRAGGTAVLVGPHLLDLDVILPPDHPLVLNDLVESYRWFGETWVRALELLGVGSRVVTPTESREQRELARQPEHQAREAIVRRACYASNSAYEVVVGQRKVVGLCMIRRRTGTLLQAGVVLRSKNKILADLLGQTAEEQALLRAELPVRTVGLDELAGRTITTPEVMQAFHTALDAPSKRV